MSFAENPNFNFRKIHTEFSQTKAGVRLANNTRYSIFQGELTNVEWQKMLGYDVNNLEHGRYTYGITRFFINHINQSDSTIKFDNQEQNLLLITSISHDWPEGVTEKGDIPYNQKNDQDEQNELEVVEQIITEILGPDSLELSNQIKNILEDKSSKLGMAFNSIEKIGYLKTALKSWEKSKTTDSKTSENLILLTNNVFLNQIPKLIEYSSIYPPVDSFLKNKQNLISEAFNNIPNSIFEKYDSVQDKAKNTIKFNQAKNDWNQYIAKF